MEAEKYLRAGRLEEALAALEHSVRQAPDEARLRVFLFQLLCVMGQWERALTQLQVMVDIDPECVLLAQSYRPVIQCELLRGDVFSGARTPVIFGEPEDWIGQLIQAAQLTARGDIQAAAALREQAFAAAPATAGTIGDESFSWIADADPRLGPVLEVMLDGAYYWAPFSRIKEIQIKLASPPDLRNFVWAPATFIWTNGGTASGLIPTRYPGTEASKDDGLRLARKTEWVDNGDQFNTGLGQRLFATDRSEYPLLDTTKIELVSA